MLKMSNVLEEFTFEAKACIIEEFIRQKITRDILREHINLTPTKMIDRTKNPKTKLGQMIVHGAVLQIKYNTLMFDIINLINSNEITDYLFNKLKEDGEVEK